MKRVVTLLILIFSFLSASAQHENYPPGSIVPQSVLASGNIRSYFTRQTIPDDIFKFMQGKSFKNNCTTAREDLEYLLCLHKDLYGNTVVGEIIVNKKIAAKVLSILEELYRISYPIEKMRLVDYYNADDEASMRSNNSSGFNFRLIANTNKVSKHGQGLAIDINPLYNPYHKVNKDGSVVVEPATALIFTDRKRKFDYKIEKGDVCVSLFTAAGFIWGGDWKSCKDYQHFEYAE